MIWELSWTDEETGELLFETQEIDLSDMSYIVSMISWNILIWWIFILNTIIIRLAV